MKKVFISSLKILLPALDQTDKLTEGIKKMQKKDLYAVSVALNSIDPGKTIDGKICKTAYKHNGTQYKEADDMCGVQMNSSSQSSNNSKTGLAELWNTGGSSNAWGGGYDKGSSEAVGPKTSAKISMVCSNRKKVKYQVHSREVVKERK